MRTVIQRVSSASVTVDGRVVGTIGVGLVALVGVIEGDTESDADRVADKLAQLRIFSDADGKMNRSVLEVGGEVLVVSQFTLAADARRGRRPSFTAAADPPVAEPLVDRVIEQLENHGLTVATGVFRADMQVALVNDGPVTIIYDTP